MAITPGFIKSVIDEVEEPWKALDDRETDWHSYLTGKWEAGSVIPERYTKTWDMPSREMDRLSRQVRGLLDLTLEVGVEPQSHLKREETKADDEEVFLGHLYLRLNPNGLTRQATHLHQTVSRFAAWWVEMDEFALPKKGKDMSDAKWKDEKERYRKKWMPWRMQVVKPSTVAAEEKDLNVTLATRRFKLRAVDLAERYGKREKDDSDDDPDMMLNIFNRSFPYLRGSAESGRGDEDAGRWQGKEFEVFCIDTGSKIYHCIEDPTDSAKKYEIAAEYPNPFGRPSLVLVPGNYKHGFDLEDRFEPLLIAIMQNFKNEAEIRAFTLTMALQPRFRYVELPESVAQMRANAFESGASQAIPTTDANGKPLALIEVLGKMGEMVDEPSEALRWIVEDIHAEGERLRPNQMLTGPDEETVKQSTATGMLAAMDAGQLEMQEAIAFETGAWETVFRMVEHSLGHKSIKGEGVSVSAYGEERVRGREVERGTPVAITFDDVDFDHIIRVRAIDERPAQNAMRQAQAQILWDRGEMLWEDYAAALGKQNASGFGKQLLAQKLNQMSRPQIINAATTHRVQFIAARDGIPPERLITLLAPAEPMPMGAESATNANAGGQQMKSPQTQGQSVETAAIP